MSVNIGQRIEPRTVDEALQDAQTAIADGQLYRAIAIADAALRRGLVHPLFYNLKAHELEEQERFAEAMIYLQRALEISPNDHQLLHGVGLCLYKQEQYLEAMIAFEAALRNRPDFAPSMHFLGVILEILGEDDAATRCYQDAVAADALYPDPLSGLASIAARRGRSEEARAFAARSLALDPNNLGAVTALATANLKDGRPEEAELAFRTLLARHDLTVADRASLASLLADSLDAQDKQQEAFAAYTKAKADHLAASADRLAEARSFLDIVEQTTASLGAVKRWRKSPPESRRDAAPNVHAFLIGFPRSGTTLLEQVLAAHSDVVSMDEHPALDAQAGTYLYAEDGFEKLLKLDGDALEEARRAYWQRISDLDLDIRGKTFIDKLPLNTMKLPLIARLFPDAKILFARRDPRDVVWSCFRRNFRMNAGMAELTSPERAARFYSAVMTLAEAARTKLPLDEHVVRHEALIEDFDGQSQAAAAFLGLDWREEMRDFADQAAKRPLRSPSAQQVRRGLYTEGMGQWRRYAEQLEPILPILRPWVEKFGYTES